MKKKILPVLALVLIVMRIYAAPFGTAFTYQGHLDSGGAPANGGFDLQFALFDAATNGNLVGAALTNSAVAVSNGLFTVTLDFGSAALAGNALWLAIDARTNGNGAFTPLFPLQQIQPAPYAVTANNLNGTLPTSQLTGALPAAALAGTYGDVVSLTNAANQLSGAFAGNGAAVSNVNAAALNGLAATNFWKTAGNAGTVPGTNFLGTTDNQPLELRVRSQRALRLEPNTNGAPNVIGGASANLVDLGVSGATIAGGGATNYGGSATNLGRAYTNRISADFGSIGGGLMNRIGADAFDAVIAGGYTNLIEADSFDSTISGGTQNYIQSLAEESTIAGGLDNFIGTNSYLAAIGGGYFNTIGLGEASPGATIPGGLNNTADGPGSFAAGTNTEASGSTAFAVGANAVAENNGAFVWGDESGVFTTSASDNSVTFRASGGYRLFSNSGTAGVKLAAGTSAWATISDRNQKKNITPLDTGAVLEKLAQVPVSQWNYKWETNGSVPNIGPMAQDFKAAFYPGRDDKSITTLEFDGVELAAIQGLNHKLEQHVREQQAELTELKARLATLEKLIVAGAAQKSLTGH